MKVWLSTYIEEYWVNCKVMQMTNILLSSLETSFIQYTFIIKSIYSSSKKQNIYIVANKYVDHCIKTSIC